jgi:hypothetical protein
MAHCPSGRAPGSERVGRGGSGPRATRAGGQRHRPAPRGRRTAPGGCRRRRSPARPPRADCSSTGSARWRPSSARPTPAWAVAPSDTGRRSAGLWHRGSHSLRAGEAGLGAGGSRRSSGRARREGAAYGGGARPLHCSRQSASREAGASLARSEPDRRGPHGGRAQARSQPHLPGQESRKFFLDAWWDLGPWERRAAKRSASSASVQRTRRGAVLLNTLERAPFWGLDDV